MSNTKRRILAKAWAGALLLGCTGGTPPVADDGLPREAGLGMFDATKASTSSPIELAPASDAKSYNKEPDGIAADALTAKAMTDGTDQGAATMCSLGTPCPSGAPCPDLTIDQGLMGSSTLITVDSFAADSCEVVEGCIASPGTRKLLRFSAATENVGTADLTLGDPSGSTCFEWSACHMHYHFNSFARFTLYAKDQSTVAATGSKRAFCVEDVDKSPSYNPPVPSVASPFTCQNQGLHVGYWDVYGNDLPCQWIDITDVPSGDYVLSAEVNYAHVIPESNYSNNDTRVPVTIP